MQKSINWGILGCGGIAHKFVQDMALVPEANLIAVASRDQQRADEFGNQYQAKNCYGSYLELVQDPEVEVIYVATRHPQHAEATLLCLENGKAVLCEKPFGMNEGEVRQMINMAKEKNLFLMEALWTYFIPATVKMMSLIEEGLIGDIRTVNADFGYLGNKDPKGRLFNKELGGGSLLDIGIYPLFMSLMTLGMPEKIQASAVFSDTEVDESCAMILDYSSGALAVLNSTFAANTQVEAWIHGTKGSLKLHRMFHFASALSYYKNGELVETFEIPVLGHGYSHEIIHVNECLGKGLKESPTMTHDISLNLINLLDFVREKIGLDY